MHLVGLTSHGRLGWPLAQGILREPSAEEVSQLEAEEAWFTILAAAHKGLPKPGELLRVRCREQNTRSCRIPLIQLEGHLGWV